MSLVGRAQRVRTKFCNQYIGENLMDRRSIIKHAGITGVLAAGAAPAVHAQAAIRWRLASSFPKSLDTIYGGADVFSKAVKAMSGGKFEISVHAGGELMPPFGVMDGVQQGTVEMCHTVPYYFYGKNPAFALGSAIPFGFNARQMNAWMLYGNGRKLMNEFYANYNAISFAGGNTGTQMGGWFRNPIKGLADLKGLKMRIPGIGGELMAKLGAVPQTLAGGDIYPALEKGTIDATEWVGPYDDEKLGFFKIAKNYYYPGFWEPGPQITFMINKEHWAKLPKAYQAALKAAAAEANVTMQAEYDHKNPLALGRLLKQGVKLQAYPKDVMVAAQKAAEELYAEESAKNPLFKKIYASWLPYRNTQSRWFSVAEGTMDRFTQSTPLK